mgnify:CR=1 FL=1
MKQNNDPIRQENKKALPKFVLLSVGGIILGAVLGVALVFLNVENFVDTLDSAGRLFAVHGAPWLLMALPLVELALCLPIYFSAKKQFARWDGEDENASNEVETKLSVCIWVTGLCTVLALFLLSAMFAGFVVNAGTPQMMPAPMFFGGLAAFLVNLFAPMVLQQKLVDLTKRLNPEKQGSVYDTKFQKTWYESCDEAERVIIGQCAFKAYQAMCRVCMVLWMMFALGGLFFSWGFLPSMAVCIVWGVGQTVYSYWCLKLGSPGGKM